MNHKIVDYSLDDRGRFIIDNYNWAAPFSNFLPGIGGKWGIPLWSYYINRGQCISSMGIKDKDHAILEFLSFNKACQVIGQQGFRTFLKIDGQNIYEVFRKTRNKDIVQRMLISSHELEIQENNSAMGLEISVRYFPLVNLPLAGLVRQVRIKNESNKSWDIELLDGVSRILPYGVNSNHMKSIPRHIEGMMGVFEVSGVPYYQLKQTAADIEEIGTLDGGNFYFSILDGVKTHQENMIIDPKLIFEEIEGLDFPWAFDHQTIEKILSCTQVRENRTPCAFTAISKTLSNNESVQLDSVLGFADSPGQLIKCLTELNSPELLRSKRDENHQIITDIKQVALTISEEPAFDQYCQQTYLDNVMRGGIPFILKGSESETVFYTYIRQGGGLERDYHWFDLEPTYLSQGNGHYRNVLQNRRMDNWFFPKIGDHNIITFMNLIQLDGFNPLVVNSVTFTAREIEKIKKLLAIAMENEVTAASLVEYVQKPFTPGGFIMQLEKFGGANLQDYEIILADLLQFCEPGEIGSLHAGFWIDHWFYNLDLIEAYLAIYPEKMVGLFFDTFKYTFYDNPDIVQPRSQKTKLANGKVRQFGAVVRDGEKEKLIHSRKNEPCKVRTKYGYGQVYYTNLLGKLLCLLANKIASLDVNGVGLEMEAGKPGWCDSLNGLPGLFGSSLCESLEIIRMCRLLLKGLEIQKSPTAKTFLLYEELYTFVIGLNEILISAQNSDLPNRAWNFWDLSHTLKEEYQEKVKYGISGEESPIEISLLIEFCDNCIALIEKNIVSSPEEIVFRNGIPLTYFINEVVEYDRVPDSADNLVIPTRIHQKPVSIFLEGPVHYLRTYPEKALQIYQNVRSSGLFDQKLDTFKSCASLEEEPFEIGRIKAYPSGWIEHEGIYTHMQFKWLLELLRAGLHDEFFQEIKTTFPPFLDPKIYGRSILENCSFIASRANPDKSIHGRAFQPRYSGVTSELLNIWNLMTVGQQPFFMLDDNQLGFHLKPVLPEWLFTKKEKVINLRNAKGELNELRLQPNSFAFKFLGTTLIHYHNPKRLSTIGKNAAQIQSYVLVHHDEKEFKESGGYVKNLLARDLRDGKFARVNVLLG